MKLLITPFLFLLSVAAVQAQTGPATGIPLAGYFNFFPQPLILSIRFDGNSQDIAKVLPASHTSSVYNHDGAAFSGYVRSTSSESYNANVVDYVQCKKNVEEYKQNVKSGKWTRFVNGE